MVGFRPGRGRGALGGLCGVCRKLLPFLGGFAGMGASRGFIDLARYAAAEMHPPDGRARAMSLVVLGGTVGAIAGRPGRRPLARWRLFSAPPRWLGPILPALC